jgi:hypothetical protein
MERALAAVPVGSVTLFLPEQSLEMFVVQLVGDGGHAFAERIAARFDAAGS